MRMSAVIRELMAAGVTGNDLVTAIERIEDASAPPRSGNAERQARFRARKAAAGVTSNVTGVTSVTDCPPLSSPPLTPPDPQTPPPYNPPPTPETGRKRAVRCPADWHPSPLPADLQAEIDRQPAGWEARQLAAMRDWSLNSPNGAKVNWDAAWRNWLRRELTNGKRDLGGHIGSPPVRQYRRDPAWEGLQRLRADLGWPGDGAAPGFAGD